MTLAVELAMDIVQLTAVLIPILLGIVRYYVSSQDDVVEKSLGINKQEGTSGDRLDAIFDQMVSAYSTILFMPLFLAYMCAYTIIADYGNFILTMSVIFYGGFLTLLYAAIPYTLGEKREARRFFILGIGFIILLPATVIISL